MNSINIGNGNLNAVISDRNEVFSEYLEKVKYPEQHGVLIATYYEIDPGSKHLVLKTTTRFISEMVFIRYVQMIYLKRKNTALDRVEFYQKHKSK